MLTSGIFRSRVVDGGGGALGLTANSGVIQSFSFAVFIVPITKDLGISRGELLSAPVYRLVPSFSRSRRSSARRSTAMGCASCTW